LTVTTTVRTGTVTLTVSEVSAVSNATGTITTGLCFYNGQDILTPCTAIISPTSKTSDGEIGASNFVKAIFNSLFRVRIYPDARIMVRDTTPDDETGGQ